MAPDAFALAQAAALRGHAEEINVERQRLQAAAVAKDVEAKRAWLAFGDIDNQWQALMSAAHTLEQPEDFFERLRAELAEAEDGDCS